jgi:hypothetical protein
MARERKKGELHEPVEMSADFGLQALPSGTNYAPFASTHSRVRSQLPVRFVNASADHATMSRSWKVFPFSCVFLFSGDRCRGRTSGHVSIG